MELKNILARQPGPEVQQQLATYKENLKEKSAQMKKMLEELKQAQEQVNNKFQFLFCRSIFINSISKDLGKKWPALKRNTLRKEPKKTRNDLHKLIPSRILKLPFHMPILVPQDTQVSMMDSWLADMQMPNKLREDVLILLYNNLQKYNSLSITLKI